MNVRRGWPLVLGLLASCAPGTGGVELEVSATSPVVGIARLRLLVEQGGKEKVEEFALPDAPVTFPPKKTVPLLFDKDRKGAVKITVTAIDTSGNDVASGVGEGEIVPSEVRTVRVLLGGAPPDMATTGDGGDGGDGGGGGADLTFLCKGDKDCTGATPRCEVATGKCVECLPQNDNCSMGNKCAQKNGVWTCVPGCQNDAYCMKLMGADSRCCGEVCVDIAKDRDHCNGCGKACDGGKACCAKACVDTNADVKNCGMCGMACGQVANGTSSCSGGQCAVACMGAFKNCDGKYDNGCEVNTSLDPANCGDCGTACTPANATPGCAMSKCTITSCNMGFADCDKDVADGCEINVLGDPKHCSGCAKACMVPNAVASCGMGVCGVGMCNAPYSDCDKDAKNGCEVNTSNDASNCGTCKMACTVANGTPECASSKCAVKSCNAGFGDCDKDAQNGCETNTTSDAKHCGMCAAACVLANATPACVASKCAVMACTKPFDDCDKAPANGCEINLNTDAMNCGTCKKPCALSHATPECAAGVCKVKSCDAGWGNCDNMDANGCETDLTTSSTHCKTCGAACGKGQSCAASTCKDDVLVVGTDTLVMQAGLKDVQTKLKGTAAFGKVDIFDGAAGTPTDGQFQTYAAVLVYSDPGKSFNNPTGLGDALARYFEGGGRVVTAAMANSTDRPLGGKFVASYMLFNVDGAGMASPNDEIVVPPAQQGHVLVAGVATFKAIIGHQTTSTVASAKSIAVWKNTANPLVAEGTRANRKRADLNFLPPSNDAKVGSWTGDGALLLRNALLYK